MRKVKLFGSLAVCFLAPVIASQNALACSDERPMLLNSPPPAFEVRLHALDDGVAQVSGVATLPTFHVGAEQQDECIVATAFDRLIVVESIKFIPEDEDTDAAINSINFSRFRLNRELDLFGRSYDVYVATALTDIAGTDAKVEIEFTAFLRSLNEAALADLFTSGRIGTAQSDTDGGVIGHAGVIAPVGTILCLGPVDPATGLTTCPSQAEEDDDSDEEDTD